MKAYFAPLPKRVKTERDKDRIEKSAESEHPNKAQSHSLIGLSASKSSGAVNESAEGLAHRLGIECGKPVRPVYLTEDLASWYIFQRNFRPTSDRESFEAQWNLHPPTFHELKMFGKTVRECRYSQSWGISYKYSGATNVARPVEESSMVEDLIETANRLVGCEAFNGCLQNW